MSLPLFCFVPYEKIPPSKFPLAFLYAIRYNVLKDGDKMCTQNTLTVVLEEVKDGLTAIFGSSLDNVLLYGSYARGDQDAESDIDILALLDLPAEKLDDYENDVLDLSMEIGLRYDVLLSILLQDRKTFQKYQKAMPFFINVLREGISLV